MHVNFRGYPGRTTVPTCTTVIPNGKKTIRGTTPCFAGAAGTRTVRGIKATVYRVNQDADQWHILFAWHDNGSLYTISEHVIKPYVSSTLVTKNLTDACAPRARSAPGLMRFTRRQFLGGAAAAAAGGAGIYELVDQLGSAPIRPVAEPGGLPPEQHLFDLRSVQSEGVEVLVPPLHSEVVTATIPSTICAPAQRGSSRRWNGSTPSTRGPRGARRHGRLGAALLHRARRHPGRTHLPLDRRTGRSVLLPNRRFPSDPNGTVLESNDVAVLLRSDHGDHIDAAHKALFDDLKLFNVTSIRGGFAGGGSKAARAYRRSSPSQPGIPGADLIPDGSELFLGFTSTQKAGLGPGLIANHETLGFVDVRGGYFHGGTHMHLSHITEDLEAWYLNFDFDERVLTAFQPGLPTVKQGAQTVPQGPKDVATAAETARKFKETGRFGHSASIQLTSRLQQDVVGPNGVVYPKGSAIPQRADFNTLDNPFAFSAITRSTSSRPIRSRASISSSSTRRVTTSSGTGSRWTASSPTARSSMSNRAPALRASTPC